MPVLPFRVFGDVARHEAFPFRGVLSELADRSEFLTRRSIALIGSAIPLCRSAFRRLCGFPSPGCPPTVKQTKHTLFGFRLPPESCPTSPSSPAAAGKHLSWAFAPFSTSGSGGPPAASLASARYVPPSGFPNPLDGLLPPSPCRFCFTPAALMGFALRSFPLPKGTRRSHDRMNPLAV
jgi:hypothetical protein